MNYFNYNGKIYKEGSPVIGPDNRGLRYGDGLFETIKVKNGTLMFEDDHFARLWKGLKVLQFEIPRHFTPENLKTEINSIIRKNEHDAMARVRINIVRGDGGLYDTKNHAPNYIIQTWPLDQGNEEWNSNGLVIGIYEAAKKSCDTLSNLKHNNYLPYLLAALHAKKEKWNDALVLNTSGRICDSTIANVFTIKDNTVYTPSLGEGCVAGILRKMLIKNLLDTGWQVVEDQLTVTQLLLAEEVFLTNSIYNMRWVQRLGDVSYGNALTKKIFADVLQTIL